MKEVLFVDCCIRGEQSRTAQVARAFLSALDPARFHVTVVSPEREDLRPLAGARFEERQRLVAQGDLNHPSLRHARQFAQADLVVMAAPFWDLSFPALLKVYVENVSVDGITFQYTEKGLQGLCRGSHLIFLTTRGGFYGDSHMEQGSCYLKALKDFFGFGAYACVSAEGLDVMGSDILALVDDACRRAKALAESL